MSTVLRIGAALNFEPLADFVLIEPIEKTMTAGGIALPEGAEQDLPQGKVVRVGPGRWTDYGVFVNNDQVKIGETYYLAFAYAPAVPLTLGGKKYLLCRSRDLCGRVQA